MSFAYKCPGTTVAGIRGERSVHGACCAQFALSNPERRERIGVRYHVPDPIIAVDEDDTEPITVGELIEVVRLLQLADDEGVPPPVSLVQDVVVPADFPQDELDALLELGSAYGLRARITRLSADRAD